MKKMGEVYLIGAGPGHAGLMTVRGKQLLETCEVLVYDSLVHPSVLGLASENCEKFYVGKKARAKHGLDQTQINHLLIRLVKHGKKVARLKGGDPFVFGRGGEEALALKRAKIPFEVVPGVTAALGASAFAGIPVTHRKIASDVTFITAHEDPTKKATQVNWQALALFSGTLVIYMGLHNLDKISKLLIRYGKSPKTPAAIIEWGASANQRTVQGNLETIAEKAKKNNIQSPAVIVIGPVVNLRKDLNWFEKKPLFGKTILVTRARHQSGQLRAELEHLGACVFELPTIEIQPVSDWRAFDRTCSEFHEYDFLVLTSENGVRAFLTRLKILGRDVRMLKGIRILAIGSGTANALSECGLIADLIPDDYSSKGLLEAVRERDWIRNKRFLLLRTSIAPRFLTDSLKREGAQVTEINVYETRKPKNLRMQISKILKEKSIDILTFTSSSTAEHFFKALPRGKKRFNAKIISIGPVTSETIKKFGARVNAEANPHTIPGLVTAIVNGVNKK